MTRSDRDSSVRGPQSSSYGFLWLIMVPSTEILLAVLGATLGGVTWTGFVGCAVGMSLLIVLVQQAIRVEVDDDGVAVVSIGYRVPVPWSAIERLATGRFGATLILGRPVRLGPIWVRNLSVAAFDPGWRNRAVGQAIIARLNPCA